MQAWSGTEVEISTWIEKLRADTDIEISGAAELAAAQADRQRDGAFVFYQSESAGDNALDNAVRQQRRITVGVALAVSNARRRGADGVTGIEAARRKVMDALVGWWPAGAIAPVTFAGGRLVGFTKATLWWLDEFTVSEFLSAA